MGLRAELLGFILTAIPFELFLCEHGKDIFFNKNKNIQNILLIFGIPSRNVCPNIMLKFHMDIPNRLEDIKQKPEKMVSGIFKIARYGRDIFKDYFKNIEAIICL